MPFLLLNGRQYTVAKDSWFEVKRRAGTVLGSTMSGGLVSVRGYDVDAWECTLTPVASADWAALRMHAEGLGQAWSFADGRRWSTGGVVGVVTGTATYATTGGRLARVGLEGCLELSSGGTWSVRAVNKLGLGVSWSPSRHGFTFGGWVYLTVADDGVAANGWHFFAVTGATTWSIGTANPGGVTQYLSNPASPLTAPASGSHGLGRIVQVNTISPYCALAAQQLDGGGAIARKFQDVFLVPYQMTAAQVNALHDFFVEGGQHTDGMSASGLLPFVVVDGDCVESPRLARVRITRAPMVNVGGANNARLPTLRIDEHRMTTGSDPFSAAPPAIEIAAPEVYYPLGTPEEIYTSGGNDIGSTNYWGSAGTYHYISNPTGGDAIVTNPGPPTSPEVTWNDDGDLDYHDVVGTGTSISYPTSYDTLTTETINHDSYARAYLPKTGDLTFYCHFRMRSGVIAASPSGVFHIFSNLDMPTFNGNIFSGWRAYATLGGVVGQVGRYDDGLGGTEGFLSAVASGTLSEETWYDMTVVFDRTANEMRVYLDGVLGATVADISSLSGDDIGAAMRSYGKPTLGGWLDYSLPYGQFHYVTAGDLREIAFWQSAVSAAEIGQLHQNRLDGVPLHTYLGLT